MLYQLQFISWLLARQHVISSITVHVLSPRYTLHTYARCTGPYAMSVCGNVNDDEGGVPEYGWKVDFDHKFPDPRTPSYMPRIKQILQLLPLIVRYNIIWTFHQLGRDGKPADRIGLSLGSLNCFSPLDFFFYSPYCTRGDD